MARSLCGSRLVLQLDGHTDSCFVTVITRPGTSARACEDGGPGHLQWNHI